MSADQLPGAAARALLLGLAGQPEPLAVLWLAAANLTACGQLPSAVLHRWASSLQCQSACAKLNKGLVLRWCLTSSHQLDHFTVSIEGHASPPQMNSRDRVCCDEK